MSEHSEEVISILDQIINDFVDDAIGEVESGISNTKLPLTTESIEALKNQKMHEPNQEMNAISGGNPSVSPTLKQRAQSLNALDDADHEGLKQNRSSLLDIANSVDCLFNLKKSKVDGSPIDETGLEPVVRTESEDLFIDEMTDRLAALSAPDDDSDDSDECPSENEEDEMESMRRNSNAEALQNLAKENQPSPPLSTNPQSASDEFKWSSDGFENQRTENVRALESDHDDASDEENWKEEIKQSEQDAEESKAHQKNENKHDHIEEVLLSLSFLIAGVVMACHSIGAAF